MEYTFIQDFLFYIFKIINFNYFLFFIFKTLDIFIFLLLTVAFLTLLERKVLGGIQRRKGPNVVGYFGILQPFADALKLLIKESIIPGISNKYFFLLSPVFILFFSLFNWGFVPIGEYLIIIDANLAILALFAVSSLNVYSIIIAGWSSNSKYSFLGSLRSAAQMISYEVSLGLIFINLLICVGSLSLIDIVEFQTECWFFLAFFPLLILFFISILAETNRPPFDLPEAEAELVSGYNVEYSAVGFAFFFIGEYANIFLMSGLCVIFFWGGWLPIFNYFIINCYFSDFGFWFFLKIIFISFVFIWVRSSFPRFRYDQLMYLGWKVILPISLMLVFLNSCLLIFFNLV